MTQQQSPPWYRPGDIPASVRRATAREEISTADIVDVLATQEVDTSRDRVATLVETARDQITTTPTEERTPTPETADVDPRAPNPRVVAAEDIAYLGPRDFARVLGATLSRYEGSFHLPEQGDESAVDLFWHRQHGTVALRTVPRSPDTTVDDKIVQTVANGDTNPAGGQLASCVGIITNTEFTSTTHALADANVIQLFEQPIVEQWLHDVQLTHDVLGRVLEQHSHSKENYDTLLDDLPTIPPKLQAKDPFTRSPTNITQPPSSLNREPIRDQDTAQASDENTHKERDSGESLGEPPATNGEQGVLYADPDEDGDAAAVDRFAAELMEESE